MSEGQSGYVFVCTDELSKEDGVELPTEEDGALLLSVVQSQFEGASGLKYRNPTTGGWRAVKLVDGTLCPPAKDGWGDGTYVVVMSTAKSTTDSNGDTDASVGFAVSSAPSVGYSSGGGSSGDGYKRKLEDVEGERASKNPRSSSPDFYGQDTGDAGSPPPPPPLSSSSTSSGSHQPNLQDLIVLGLEYKATDEDLKGYFQKFGEVTHAEVKKDPVTGKSRGFGFVRFSDAELQRKVLTMKHAIKDRRIELRLPRQSPAYMPSKLFIGCLPLKPEVTTDELSEYFSKYGKLDDVYIPRPYRGFGFVSFNDPQVAQRVLKESHSLRKSTLNITPADPKGSVRGGHHGPHFHPHYPPSNYDPYNQQQNYYGYGYAQPPQQTGGAHYGYAGPPQNTSYSYGYQAGGNYPPPPPPPQSSQTDKQTQGYMQHRSYQPTAAQQRLPGNDPSRPVQQQQSGYHYSQPPAPYSSQTQGATTQSYQHPQQRQGVDRGHYGYGMDRASSFGTDQRAQGGYQRDGHQQPQQQQGQGQYYDPKSTWQNY